MFVYLCTIAGSKGTKNTPTLKQTKLNNETGESKHNTIRSTTFMTSFVNLAQNLPSYLDVHVIIQKYILYILYSYICFLYSFGYQGKGPRAAIP